MFHDIHICEQFPSNTVALHLKKQKQKPLFDTLIYAKYIYIFFLYLNN